jgi:hypothetical protein
MIFFVGQPRLVSARYQSLEIKKLFCFQQSSLGLRGGYAGFQRNLSKLGQCRILAQNFPLCGNLPSRLERVMMIQNPKKTFCQVFK